MVTRTSLGRNADILPHLIPIVEYTYGQFRVGSVEADLP